jgi:hypothetical protein
MSHERNGDLGDLNGVCIELPFLAPNEADSRRAERSRFDRSVRAGEAVTSEVGSDSKRGFSDAEGNLEPVGEVLREGRTRCAG